MEECSIVAVQNPTINRFWCQCQRGDKKNE